MAVKVALVLDAPDDALLAAAYGAGALMRLERAASETGAYSEIATVAIVTATYHYEQWDAGGDETSWYRWRLSNVANTEQGAYSPPFQGIEAAIAARNAGSYATVDDVFLGLGRVPTDSFALGRYERALVEARERLDQLVGADFFRHPQSGTEVRDYMGTGTKTLHVHGGIVSLTTVQLKEDDNGSWITVAANDWQLESWAGGGTDVLNPMPGWPSDHVVLTGRVTYSEWPKGKAPRARLTGAFGWARVPRQAVAANVLLARYDIAAETTYPGSVGGQPELGRPLAGEFLPRPVWDLHRRRVEAFMGCHL